MINSIIMKRFVCAIFLLTAIHVFSQEQSGFEQKYDEVFHFKKTPRFSYKQVTKISDSDPDASFINSNQIYLDYLLQNFATIDFNSLNQIEDSIQRQKEFISLLKNDSLLASSLHDFISWNRKYISIRKDTFTIDQLMDFAVKFFTIKDINQDGYYVAKMCVGINGIKTTEPKRNPTVEAFCFSSIMMFMDDSAYNIYNEFLENARFLYKLNLGTEKNEKILRAQGALYMLMFKNEALRKLITDSYQQRKKYMPFVLVK